MKFDPSGPYTIEWAIECARNGHPWTLLWMIADQMGTEAASVLADLLKHPEKLVKGKRAMYLPNEARGIRELYKHKRRTNPKKAAPIIQAEMAETFAISEGALLDIIRQKNTYAEERGRSATRTPTRKRKK